MAQNESASGGEVSGRGRHDRGLIAKLSACVRYVFSWGDALAEVFTAEVALQTFLRGTPERVSCAAS